MATTSAPTDDFAVLDRLITRALVVLRTARTSCAQQRTAQSLDALDRAGQNLDALLDFRSAVARRGHRSLPSPPRAAEGRSA